MDSSLGARAPLGNIGPNAAPTHYLTPNKLSKVNTARHVASSYKQDFLPSIEARLYSCDSNCNDSLYIRRAGEVYCYTCCAPVSRNADITSPPPANTDRLASDQSRANEIPLAASMLKPGVDDDDDDEDEVSFAPRHRIHVAVARAPAADTPELTARVSNAQAESDLKAQVSRLERDLGLAQGVSRMRAQGVSGLILSTPSSLHTPLS